jgi:hypothetical protein
MKSDTRVQKGLSKIQQATRVVPNVFKSMVEETLVCGVLCHV